MTDPAEAERIADPVRIGDDFGEENWDYSQPVQPILNFN